MAELKPCPFCGGKKIMECRHKSPAMAIRYTVKCLDCMGEMTRTAPHKAREAWNNRAESEELKFTRDFIHEHGLEFELASAWERRKKDGK